MADEQQTGDIEELPPPAAPDVQDTDEGGAVVTIGPEPVEEDSEFYGNLLETDIVSTPDLQKMVLEVVDRIQDDKTSRKDFDDDYAEGLKRTGVGKEAPGGASFQGASRVVHPMLAKAAIDYNSRAMAEIMPAGGPVKDFIPGTPTKERVEKARRKVAYMNWQLKTQIPEFRREMDKITTQTPIAGSQFLVWNWNHKLKRPECIYWPTDKVSFPYSASSCYSSERFTLHETISDFEFKRRVASGEYFLREGVQVIASPMPPERTAAEKVVDKGQGQEPSPNNRDGYHEMGRCYTWFEIEGELLPYTMVIDLTNHVAVSLVRNWEEEEKSKEPMLWWAEIPFLPWRGALTLGLVQFIGSLAGASTGSIRALLDSAHVNNLPTLLKLKGANFSGQSQTANATEVTEIEGAVSGDMDIRKLVMAIPFNPPSLVLLQLLGLVTQEGQSFVQVTLDKLGEQRADMPVGTTLALIEQGLKTLSGIHGRLYEAMNRILAILHRINRMYITDEEIKNDTGEMLAFRSDFQGPLDVVPVSDPEIFSDIQRFAQIQLVAQRAQLLPQLYDLRKVEELILSRTKIPDAKDLLLPEMKPTEMNQVNENAAMALGRPVAAFPEQDHLAHIQVLLDFMTNPFFGMSKLIGPDFIPKAIAHLKEHVVLWYVNEFYQKANAEIPQGKELGDMMKNSDPETRAEVDRLLAEISDDVVAEGAQLFAQIPTILEQAQQFIDSITPQMPQDPTLAKEGLVQQGKDKDRQAQQALASLKESSAQQRELIKQAAEARRNTQTLQSEESRNTDDNLTALTIASAEIQSDERIGVSTGTGINPGG